MQDKYINEFIKELSTKLDVETLNTVRFTFEIWGKDYEIKEKETSLISINEDIFKELKEFLVMKHIEGYSDRTISLYNNYINHFLCYVNKPVTDINKIDIVEYLYNKQKNSNIKDITANSIRACIGSFFSWLTVNGYIPSNPMLQIKPIKCEKNTRHSLSSIDMEKLRDSCDNLRDKALIEVLYSSGCRVSELINIKLSDINISTNEVHLFGKGKKHRISYLNSRATLALTKYLESRNFDSEYVFCSLRKPHNKISIREVERIIKKLKIKNNIDDTCTPHIIRHTMATDALNNGMSIEEIQQILGHANISTTLIYAESNQDNIKYSHLKHII